MVIPDNISLGGWKQPDFCSRSQGNKLYQKTNPINDLCLGIITVHNNYMRLFCAKAFFQLLLLNSCIWHSNSGYNLLNYGAISADI